MSFNTVYFVVCFDKTPIPNIIVFMYNDSLHINVLCELLSIILHLEKSPQSLLTKFFLIYNI